MVNYYSILQVDPHASEDVIKSAYRALVKIHNKDDNMMKTLNEARDALFDSTKRKNYDKERAAYSVKCFGNYKIIKEIAEGGFGRTYQAEHVILKTPVCIKQAYGVSASDEKILLEEAKSIWDLRHYGIPSIRDILRLEDGSILLVMSYVPGQTLTQIIDKHKKLDAEHVAWIAERTLNVLKYLHFHGVIHGDVKPQNIIVQPESHTVVLVDYGLSLIRPSLKSESKGYTPHFAAPEQIRGGVPLVPETDLYSLGVTMIYALGGDIERRLVPSDTPNAMCDFIKRLIKHEVLSRPNWANEDLWASFQEVRERDFGRRFSGMKKLVF